MIEVVYVPTKTSHRFHLKRCGTVWPKDKVIYISIDDLYKPVNVGSKVITRCRQCLNNENIKLFYPGMYKKGM